MYILVLLGQVRSDQYIFWGGGGRGGEALEGKKGKAWQGKARRSHEVLGPKLVTWVKLAACTLETRAAPAASRRVSRTIVKSIRYIPAWCFAFPVVQ